MYVCRQLFQLLMGNFDFLTDTAHRPWQLPKGKWQYYQQWNDALFLHFKVDDNSLRKLVPLGLSLDDFQGNYYVSLVAFKMEKIRPRLLPSWSYISDFYEINLRTYVKKQDKSGVYFLNIEAEKALSAKIARMLSGLPYEKSNIRRTLNRYHNQNKIKGFELDVEFSVGDKINTKTPLDCWLTEKYCLYLQDKDQHLRFNIHHREWDLHQVILKNIDLQYHISELKLCETDVIAAHYSSGVEVVSWSAEKV